MGRVDRLDARVRHPRARVLPLDPVDLPAPLRARARLPQGGRGQVVPEGRHRAGQRAGDRRALRALRHGGRGQAARAVVLPHHRVRRPPARRHGHDRVAAARGQDAGELDRPLGGRRGGVPLRGARHRLSRVHHPPGHALRSDLLRGRARAPGRSAPERLARGARVREPRGHRVGRRTRRRAQGEDRAAARPHRHEPGHRPADPDVRGGLRADGVRHRGRDGCARPRPARLRVRGALRPAHPTGGRGRRARARGGGVRRPHRGRAARELRRLLGAAGPGGSPRDHGLARGARPRAAHRQLPAARLAALAPALLGLPDPDRPLRVMRPRSGAGRRAAGEAAGRRGLHAQGNVAARRGHRLGAYHLPGLRRRCAPRDRHDGHLRRLVLVLPALLRRRATSSPLGTATCSPAGWASTSTSAGSSTQSCT